MPDGDESVPDAEHVIDLSVVVDDDLRIVDISDAARALGGLGPEVTDARVGDIVSPADLGALHAALDAARARGVSDPVHFSFRDAAGTFRTVVAVAEDRRDDPAVRGTVLRFESNLSRPLSSILVEGVTRFTNEAILVLDRTGVIIDGGPGIRPVFGVDPADVIGRNVASVWTSREDRELVRTTAERVATGPSGTSEVVRHRALTGSGELEWVETRLTNLYDDPLVRGMLINARVVHEEQEALLALRRQVERDVLTGLPNRRAVEQWLRGAGTGAGDERCLLVLDVAGIAPVIRTYGHQAGDDVLRRVAERLARRCGQRPLGRFEGGGFVVLCDPGEDPAQLFSELHAEVGRPLDGVAAAGWRLDLVAGSCTIERLADPGELLRRADVALTAAVLGGESHARYDDALDREMGRRRILAQDLRRALTGGEFEMRFEPLVDLADGRLVGCESLVRWRHPSRGVLAPQEFMAAMEDEGLQGELDAWVAEQVVLVAADWRRAGYGLQVGVNVSAQGLDADYGGLLAELCSRHGVDPAGISVELLESIRPRPELLPRIEDLGRLGVQLAIDDFGTGYSSLATLHRLRASAVKIDGVFVHGVEDDDGSRAIIEASVSVARAFGMSVVAEWVERESQRCALRELGVDRGQGALFGEPLTAGEFERRHLRP